MGQLVVAAVLFFTFPVQLTPIYQLAEGEIVPRLALSSRAAETVAAGVLRALIVGLCIVLAFAVPDVESLFGCVPQGRPRSLVITSPLTTSVGDAV